MMERQRKIKQRRPDYKMKTIQQVQRELATFKKFKPHEIVNFIGL
ncbi:hypothetical protein L914_06681, partial [Phytophthora nicotianae]